jgi:hypothetical protein
MDSVASWKVLPGSRAGLAIPGFLDLAIAYEIEQCGVLGTRARETLHVDSIPARLVVVGCDFGLFHNVVNSRYIKTKHVTIAGVWSPGFEDGFFSPCRNVNIPIKAPGMTNRTIVVYLDRVDTTRVPIWQALRDLGEPPTADKRYYMRWEGELTGPQPSGHSGMAAFVFRPNRVLEAKWWSDKQCRL